MAGPAVKLGALAVLALAAAYGVHGVLSGPPALVYSNSTGVYLRVHLDFDEPVYVEAIAFTTSGWLGPPVTEEKERYLIRYLYPNARHLGRWVEEETLVVRAEGLVPVQYNTYYVWDGKLVDGDDVIPLDKFGDVVWSEPALVDAGVDIDFHARDLRAPGYRLTVAGGPPGLRQAREEAVRLAQANDTEGLLRLAVVLLNATIEGVKTGLVPLGVEGYDIWYNGSRIARLIDDGVFYFRVKLVVTLKYRVGTLKTGEGDLPLYRVVVYEAKADSRGERTVSVRADTVLRTPFPVPSSGGYVVVFYRRTPYSPLHAAVLRAGARLPGGLPLPSGRP